MDRFIIVFVSFWLGLDLKEKTKKTKKVRNKDRKKERNTYLSKDSKKNEINKGTKKERKMIKRYLQKNATKEKKSQLSKDEKIFSWGVCL